MYYIWKFSNGFHHVCFGVPETYVAGPFATYLEAHDTAYRMNYS